MEMLINRFFKNVIKHVFVKEVGSIPDEETSKHQRFKNTEEPMETSKHQTFSILRIWSSSKRHECFEFEFPWFIGVVTYCSFTLTSDSIPLKIWDFMSKGWAHVSHMLAHLHPYVSPFTLYPYLQLGFIVIIYIT